MLNSNGFINFSPLLHMYIVPAYNKILTNTHKLLNAFTYDTGKIKKKNKRMKNFKAYNK